MTGEAFGDGYYAADDADDDWKPGDDPLEGLGDLDQYNNAEAEENGGDGNPEEGEEEGEDENGGWGGGGEDEAEEEEEGWGEGEDGEWDEGEGGGEEEEFAGMGAQKERLLDELYKLDYEDIVGDIPCRYERLPVFLCWYVFGASSVRRFCRKGWRACRCI